MQNAITTLRIQNFKSIKDVTMTPRRVNIIIGEPNVGKSNILEALSLLGGAVFEQSEKFMGSFIRYDEPRQLFYNNLLANTIQVLTENYRVLLGAVNDGAHLNYLAINEQAQDEFFEKTKLPALVPEEVKNSLLNFYFEKSEQHGFDFSDRANFAYSEIYDGGIYKVPGSPKGVVISQISQTSWPIKPYLFAKSLVNRQYSHTFLRPPHGDNLIDVIQAFPAVRKEINNLLKVYGQHMLLRNGQDGKQNLEVVRDFDGVFISHPYNNIADTLRRLVFYLAAIESNDDAVLLFEEPEAHSFPTYVMHLAQSIVDSRNNQFFVVTHNPYLLTEILEEMLTDDELKPELAIFAAYYEDYQTKVHQLTDEEMVAARMDGLDFFLNLRRFVPEAE